jgi:hypothetical protein
VPQRRSGRGAPSGPGRILAPTRLVRGTKDLRLSEALPLKVETGLLLGRNGRMEAAGDVPAKGAPDGGALADARGRTTAPKARRVVDAGDDAHGRSLRPRNHAEVRGYAGRDRPLGGGRAEPPFSHVATRPVDQEPVPTSLGPPPAGRSLVRRGLRFHWLYV